MPIEALPESLLHGTHPLSSWRDAGVSRRELAEPTWQKLSHGMYAWSAETEDLTERLLRIGGLAPPGGGLGGWAAAHVLGARDLDGVDGTGWIMPVVMCMPRQQTCRRAGRGVRVWRSDLEPEDLVEVQGTPVTSGVRTGFDVARLSPTRGGSGRGPADGAEALVVLEALLRTGQVSLGDIAAYASARPRFAGARQAHWVLERAVAGTRSCQETRFRQLWTLAAGLPTPLVNATIADLDGHVVAEVDLLDPDVGLVGEYDGAHHAGALRRADDHARIQRLEALGLVAIRVAAPDLTEFRGRTVHRLRALHAAASRDRRPRHWQVLRGC